MYIGVEGKLDVVSSFQLTSNLSANLSPTPYIFS
jgi:hypothetical protein